MSEPAARPRASLGEHRDRGSRADRDRRVADPHGQQRTRQPERIPTGGRSFDDFRVDGSTDFTRSSACRDLNRLVYRSSRQGRARRHPDGTVARQGAVAFVDLYSDNTCLRGRRRLCDFIARFSLLVAHPPCSWPACRGTLPRSQAPPSWTVLERFGAIPPILRAQRD